MELRPAIPALEEAVAIHTEGNPAEAIPLYEDILRTDPEAAHVRHLLGIALNQVGQHRRAIDALRQSLEQDPRNAAWWNNLGNILHGQKKHEEAVAAFLHGLEAKPQDDTLWANLGAVYQWQKKHGQAEAAYRRAVEINPLNFDALKLLANLMIILDRVEDAAAVYGHWLEKRPDDPLVAHHHAACSQRNIPEKCSASYVEKTYDTFAPIFEQRLHGLSYDGPRLIAEALHRHVQGERKLEILDACCGTGLCGPVLKPFARTLTGVDLSQKMLDRAREKHLYDALRKAELHAHLFPLRECFDLVICADALIYFGNLRPVFEATGASLRPGGLFLFTLEAAPPSPAGYRLNPTGRFSHAREYIERLASENRFELLEVTDAPVRMELNEPVAGMVVALKKTGNK